MDIDTDNKIKNGNSKKRHKEFIPENKSQTRDIFYKHVVELTPEAVVIHSEGKIVYANQAALTLVEAKHTGELVGRPVMRFIHKDSVPLIQSRIEKMLSKHKVAPFVEEKFISVKGKVVLAETKAIPFVFNGKPAIMAILRDITERKKNEEKQKYLENVSRLLNESVDYKTTLANICKLLVPQLADYIRIALLSDDDQVEEVAVYHRDPNKIPLVKKLYAAYREESGTTYGVSHIIQSGKAEIMEHVAGVAVNNSNQRVKNTIDKLHLTSYMGIPLKVRKKVIGVIICGSVTEERIYTKEDLQFAQEIALRISYAVENSRLYTGLQKELAEKEKFQTEQARLVSMLDQTYDAVFIWKLKGEIVYWNKGAQELYGYAKKEAVNRISHSLLKTVHPIPTSQIEQALLTTGRWEGELQQRTKSNEQVIVSSKMLFVVQNGERYVLETNRDITKQKNDLLGQARLASIVSSSDDAIVSKNLDSVIQTWNHAAERMFGYTAEEAIGKKIYLIIPKERYGEEVKIIERLKQGKRIKHFQTQRQRKDGRKIDVSLTISPIFNDYGQVIGASKIARDITEEVRLQNNLQFFSEASKSLGSSLDYKKTFQNLASLAVSHIADWCSVSIKEGNAIEQIAVAHIDPHKVKWAKELNKKNPPDPNAKTGVPQVLRTGNSEFVPLITDAMLVQAVKDKAQLELLRKLQLTSAMIVPIKYSNKVLGAISFISAESGHHYTKADLTLAEELANRAGIAIENARLYQKAQDSIELRDQFISLASHELKTPITSLKMFAQLLEKQFDKKKDIFMQNYFMKMDLQIDRLALLVNDLLNVSKIQHGKLEFDWKTVDLNLVIKDTVEMLQTTAVKHKIIVKGTLGKKVYADSYRVYQVLTNLLTNATKYSPNADKVIVEVTPQKDFAKVTVRDFGIGIKSSEQEKIFGQFYRVNDPNQQKFSGLGMGLFISSEIINRHGGKMSVKSVIGEGSRFSFTLPYSPDTKEKPHISSLSQGK